MTQPTGLDLCPPDPGFSRHGALKHFEQRELVNLQRGNIWPDFTCKEGNQTVGIEVVEIVNQDHAGKRHIRNQYLIRDRELIKDIYPRLSGLRIQFIDGHQEPPYPSLTTHDGQQLAKSIADNLKAEVEKLEQLPRSAVRLWQKGPALPETGALISRVSVRELEYPAVLSFQGGGFPARLSEGENLLENTINGKIKKPILRLQKENCFSWHTKYLGSVSDRIHRRQQPSLMTYFELKSTPLMKFGTVSHMLIRRSDI